MKTTEIHWEITNKCNLHCSYCRSDSGKPRPNELSPSEALGVLQKIHKAGVRRIYFTGGEPFSRLDFKDLLVESIHLGMEASVITNATLIDKETLKLIKKLGVGLNISLDSLDQSKNDEQRGFGVLSKTLSVIEEANAMGIDLQIYSTISKKNIAELESLLSFAKNKKIPIHFKEISSGGKLTKSYDGLLSSIESKHLKDFKDGEFFSDESCWADGKSLFMTSSGDLYHCNEICVRQSHSKIGNIKTFDFDHQIPKKKVSKLACCYGVNINENSITLYNTERDCGLLEELNKPIKTLKELYKELDDCYNGIHKHCLECHENDCMGYIWLLKSEARRLYRNGIPTVEINDGPTFIHSFPTNGEGEIDVTIRYPRCGQIDCSNRECLIRNKRPLVCRLYPVGLETLETGEVCWVTHLDCLFVKKMIKEGTIADFEKMMLSIIERISQPILNEIVETYKMVDEISSFPNGSNNFKLLKGGV
jgi:MoaA/NifB/PqqE/SkfB family radical SAM enzyme/Fe-S-cluster containining protein